MKSFVNPMLVAVMTRRIAPLNLCPTADEIERTLAALHAEGGPKLVMQDVLDEAHVARSAWARYKRAGRIQAHKLNALVAVVNGQLQVFQRRGKR